AGWIVAGILAVLCIAAFALRSRLLAALGLELTAAPAADEARNGVAADRNGQPDAVERNRLNGLFDLDELEVSDIMVHRTNMRSVNADNAPEAVVREILQSPHTRMPLWKGSLDSIVGVLHAKDLLRALNDVGYDFSRIYVMKVASKPW